MNVSENDDANLSLEDIPRDDLYDEQQPVLRFAKILPVASPWGAQSDVCNIRRDGGYSLHDPTEEIVRHRRDKDDAVKLAVKENINAGNTCTSNLTKDQLEKLPVYSHIDRNSRTIRGINASTIASCLFDCLRLNSIQVKYEEDEPGKFKCKTYDFVSFRINMFSFHSDPDEPSIVVEVQRRSGCSLSFQKNRRTLLGAIDGLTSAKEARRSSISHEVRCIDVSCLTCHDGLPIQKEEDDYEAIVSCTLDEIQSYLNSDKCDTQILGLELLTHLTDPLHTPAKIVQVAAMKILRSDEICQSIKAMILEGKIRSKAIEDLDMNLQYEDDFVDHSRQLSLCALLNSFNALTEYLPMILATSEEWMIEKVLPCLLNNLRDVRENVHIALLSAKCLSILAVHSKACRSHMVENNVIEVLKDVVQYGTVWHEDIRKEAESLCMKFT